MRKQKWEFNSNNADVYNVCCCGNGRYIFSPAWTYNQINGGRDRGSSIYNAFVLLRDKGGDNPNLEKKIG